jgi:hypothetical protein
MSDTPMPLCRTSCRTIRSSLSQLARSKSNLPDLESFLLEISAPQVAGQRACRVQARGRLRISCQQVEPPIGARGTRTFFPRLFVPFVHRLVFVVESVDVFVDFGHGKHN